MDKKTIIDGEHVYCLSSSEAKMLYEHINGYLNTEVVINENDIIIDIGANIGIFGIKLSKLFNNKITIFLFRSLVLLLLHNIPFLRVLRPLLHDQQFQ